tara:strand:+ start:462 stop:746 length:285 start_codon:yes stop_codon:yes gene_type:complete
MAANETVIGDSSIRIHDNSQSIEVAVEVTTTGTSAEFDISVDGDIEIESDVDGQYNYVHTTVEVMREAIRLYDAQMERIKSMKTWAACNKGTKS